MNAAAAAGVGDELYWEQLVQLVDEGRVIPVVGQDLLAVHCDGVDGLLYEHLARRAAARLRVEVSTDLNVVACRYLERGGQIEDVYTVIKSVMPSDQEIEIPEPLLQLASIEPLNLFVSTSFDSLLERAIDRVRFGGRPDAEVLSYSPQRVKDIPCPMEELRRPLVYHLLGRLSAVPDFAVTEEDTLEFVHSLQSESRRPRLLFDELNNCHLLIIGSGLSEWLARFFLRIAKRERLWMARGKTDYVADRRAQQSQPLLTFLQHFSPRTKVFRDGGAAEFVRELHQRWNDLHTPRAAPPSAPVGGEDEGADMESGAIFLSYASEDRERVREIARALRAARLPVWFDESDLHSGDSYEREIRRRIDGCSVFAPVISRQTSDPRPRFFRLEWKHAQLVAAQLPEGAKFIAPVAIDDTRPENDSVPEPFRRVQWLRLRDGDAVSDALVTEFRSLFRARQKALAGLT